MNKHPFKNHDLIRHEMTMSSVSIIICLTEANVPEEIINAIFEVRLLSCLSGTIKRLKKNPDLTLDYINYSIVTGKLSAGQKQELKHDLSNLLKCIKQEIRRVESLASTENSHIYNVNIAKRISNLKNLLSLINKLFNAI
jgi:hypothetical protein